MMQRIEYLDVLKGIAIILVVAGHAIGFLFPDFNDVFTGVKYGNAGKNAGILWNAIYKFHMPLFFFCSGYFFNNKYKIDDFLWKHVKRLLIPYFVTGWLILMVRGHFGYWYLLSLFEFSVGLFLLSKINFTSRKYLNVMAGAILLFALARILNNIDVLKFADLGRFNLYFPFFVLGWMTKIYSNYDLPKCKRILTGGVDVALLIFIILCVINYRTDNYKDISQNVLIQNVIKPLLPYIGGLCGIIVCRQLSKGLLKYMGIKKVLSFLGRHTLSIYIFHILFIPTQSQISKILMMSNGLLNSIIFQLLYISVVSLFAIGFSLAISYVICQTKVLCKLILGRNEFEYK